MIRLRAKIHCRRMLLTAICSVCLIVAAAQQPEKRQLYAALKTNMLFDAAAVPNIGAEIYVGRNISVGAGWMYAWWNCERRHRYWRIYGGEINARYWFGKADGTKPLTGHHAGLYAGIFTFDFEWGGTAYMGGKPGHNLWNRPMVNVGIEYGYSLSVSKHLNIDFTLGVGYVEGIVEKFKPTEDTYIWQSTSRQRWIGPAKAEISLVWLLGRDNVNAKKGGER